MFKKLLPHICMVMAAMFIIFVIADMVGTAMGFYTSHITRTMVLVQSVLVIILSIISIVDMRKNDRF